MKFEKEVNDQGEWIIYPSGRIDNNTSEALRTELSSVPEDVNRLILDFRDVLYITSSGLRELLICRHRFKGDRLLIKNISEPVMDIFKITGFDEILPIEEMVDDISTYVNMSFSYLLAMQANHNGDSIALMSSRGNYTWQDIEKASQIIADDLSKLGVDIGSHVGICGVNSINWILTFYAVQKLGAMAMLINPTLGAEEIGEICALGDIKILCYGEIPALAKSDSFFEEIKGAKGCNTKEFYSIKNDLDLKNRFDEYNLISGKYEREVDADSPCVVLFTSGSTGVPKGVILSSFNLLNAAVVQVKKQQMTSNDSELLVVPLFHILGLSVCLLPCALVNAPLYIPDDIHSETLINAMGEHGFTLMHAVPTMILAILNNKNFDSADFYNLRCTVLAGSSTNDKMLLRSKEAMPNNHVIIAYGLSEMAPVSQTEYGDSNEHILNTVGKPVDNIKIKIQSRETGEDCKTGEPGEVLVQGFNLMTGYYKLPLELQAIDFEGWLHTGDMGYISEDGYLTISGRYKELIIRGGENIMPLEVEEAVSDLPMIKDVKVVGVPSEFYGEEVAACVILEPEAVLDIDEMKKNLKGRLAKYKIPSYFISYDEFPELGSGKIDVKELRKDAINRILLKIVS